MADPHRLHPVLAGLLVLALLAVLLPAPGTLAASPGAPHLTLECQDPAGDCVDHPAVGGLCCAAADAPMGQDQHAGTASAPGLRPPRHLGGPPGRDEPPPLHPPRL